MRRTGLKFAKQRKQQSRPVRVAKGTGRDKQVAKEGNSSKVEQDEGQGFAKPGNPVDPTLVKSDAQERDFVEEERWFQQKAILRRAAEELAQRRSGAGAAASLVRSTDPFQRLADSLEDTSGDDCNAAVRALYDLDPDRAVSFFNLALRESSPERRRKIGAALAGSGLVNDAIKNLTGRSHNNSYGAFSLLFLVAKAGEVEPLIQVIEGHPSMELRLAVIRLLASSGEREILPTLGRLAVSNSLPVELRSAIIDVIKQISSPSETAPSAA